MICSYHIRDVFFLRLPCWDMAGTLLPTYGPHDSAVTGVTWHPNRRELVSTTVSGQIFRWSAEGQLLQHWPGHPVSTWDVAYSPDGSQFATAGSDGAVRLWSPEGNRFVDCNTCKPAI
jgi:WD40 repeat protein